MPHDSPGTGCLMLTITAKLKQNPPKRRCQMKVGYVKIGDFQQITCYNSKMLTITCQLSSVTSLSHWASTFVCSMFAMTQCIAWVRQWAYSMAGPMPVWIHRHRSSSPYEGFAKTNVLADQRSCASRDLWSVKMFVLADLWIFIECCLFFVKIFAEYCTEYSKFHMTIFREFS